MSCSHQAPSVGLNQLLMVDGKLVRVYCVNRNGQLSVILCKEEAEPRNTSTAILLR